MSALGGLFERYSLNREKRKKTKNQCCDKKMLIIVIVALRDVASASKFFILGIKNQNRISIVRRLRQPDVCIQIRPDRILMKSRSIERSSSSEPSWSETMSTMTITSNPGNVNFES